MMRECVCQAKKFARFDECAVYCFVSLGLCLLRKKQFNFLNVNQLGSSISNTPILTFYFLCIWLTHADKRKKELSFLFSSLISNPGISQCQALAPVFMFLCSFSFRFLGIGSSSIMFENLNTVSGIHSMMKHTKIHPCTCRMPIFDVFM